MRYIQPTFTLPVSTGKLTQTDWEIAVGLRNPDGTLVGAKPPQVFNVKTGKSVPLPDYWKRLTDRQREAWLLARDLKRI